MPGRPKGGAAARCPKTLAARVASQQSGAGVEQLDVDGAAGNHEEDLVGAARDVLIDAAESVAVVARDLKVWRHAQAALVADKENGDTQRLGLVDERLNFLS